METEYLRYSMNAHIIRLSAAMSGFLIVLMISACWSHAMAGSCDKVPAPEVEIENVKSEIQEAYDITAADIQHLAESTGRQPSWPGLGASSLDITYSAEITENATKEPDGSYCATLAHVHIVIALGNRVIHLAQELKENPCLERIQKEHLLRLAHADEQALAEFPIETEIRNLLGKLAPSRAKSELAAKAQVTKAVRANIQTLLDKIQNSSVEIGRKINAPAEIDRLRHEIELDPNCH